MSRLRFVPVAFLALVAVGWLALARSAAPIRAALLRGTDEAGKRLPLAVDAAKDLTGRARLRPRMHAARRWAGRTAVPAAMDVAKRTTRQIGDRVPLISADSR